MNVSRPTNYCAHAEYMPSFLGKSGLSSMDTVSFLSKVAIPRFRSDHCLPDLKKTGFRLLIDAPSEKHKAQIHLMTGPRTPNFNPQDWRTPGSTGWNPDGPAKFFDGVAETARALPLDKIFSDGIYNIDGFQPAFGRLDDDPKAETHFLMLSMDRFGCMADPGFDTAMWQKFFYGAQEILEYLGIFNQPARYIANFGEGFQQGARVHMHVLSAKDGLLKFLPQEYGFKIRDNGTIEAPENSPALSRVIALIDQRGQVKGFEAASRAQRLELDQQLFAAIRAIQLP